MWGLFVGGVLEPSTSVHVCRDHSQHPWALPSYALTPNSAAAEGRIALSLPTRPTRALSSQQEAVLLRMLPVTQELSFLILADSNGGGSSIPSPSSAKSFGVPDQYSLLSRMFSQVGGQ